MKIADLGKADLHIHSSSSYDGFSSPEIIIKQAARIGLNVIAITDHEEITGALKAEKLEKKYGVDVIVGEEVLTNEGEILALFIQTKIRPGMPLKETIKEVHNQEGLVIIPHPFTWFPITRPAITVKKLYSLFKYKDFLPDGIEIFNSMPTSRPSVKKSKRINDNIFTFAEIGGSDAHIEKHVGMGFTTFPGKTKEDLKKAILERKTKAYGEFVSTLEHMDVVKKNIVKIGKKTGKKILSPYFKLKQSINNKLNA